MIGPSPSREPRHIPVLVSEVLALLDPQPGQVFLDATVGSGGHAQILAERLGATGGLLALDRDATMLAIARSRLADTRGATVQFQRANFAQIRDVLHELGMSHVDGVIADLGICSDQLDDAARGFSFQCDGPLDMRMNKDLDTTAQDVLRTSSE